MHEENQHLISIIVPVYNVEKYIYKTLDSILFQTYNNLEIILINDGSTDNSGNICDEYSEKDKRIKVIHKQNGGVSSARNLGIDNATGEWITFIDSDDIIDKCMIEKLFKIAEKENTKISASAHKYQTKDNEIKFVVLENKTIRLNNTKVLEYIIRNDVDFGSSHHGKLFHRDVVKDFYFNTELNHGEDYLFVIEVIATYAKDIAYIPDALYYYVFRPNSASKSFSVKRFHSIDSLERIAEIIRPLSLKLLHMVNARIFMVINSISLRAVDNEKNELIPILLKRAKPYFISFVFSKNINFKRKIFGILVFLFPKFAHKFWKKYYE